MSLTRLHSKRIAVVIPITDERQIVVRGVGCLEEDDDTGDVLRVTTDEGNGGAAEDSAILVRMQPKAPTIEPDQKYGCDYSIFLE